MAGHPSTSQASRLLKNCKLVDTNDSLVARTWLRIDMRWFSINFGGYVWILRQNKINKIGNQACLVSKPFTFQSPIFRFCSLSKSSKHLSHTKSQTSISPFCKKKPRVEARKIRKRGSRNLAGNFCFAKKSRYVVSNQAS